MSTIETIAPAGTWAADPVHSNVSFEVGYAGVNAFRGGFREFTATLAGDTLEGTAKVASVDVKDEQLNGHLQSPDFFDAARFPEITFKATEITRDGAQIRATGELTLKGVTKPVELTGTIADAPATDPFGR
jgi:polyisoprenoid-binding protein YceI